MRPGRWPVVVLLCTTAAACAAINSQTYSYATLDEARRAGAIARGWLPEILPPGARDIRVAFVPDHEERWGLFNFAAADHAPLKQALQAEEVALETVTLDVPGRLEWWPVALRGPLDGERLGATGLKAYRTTDRRFMMAVNWSQGRAYYWNAPGN